MKTITLADMIGFGVIAVDDLFFLDAFPEPDTKAEVKKKERYAGGLASTALVAAARQGVSTSYFGVLGDDDLSLFTRKAFARENVDTSQCVKITGAKPFHSTIIVDQSCGGRTILYNLDGFQAPAIPQISDEKLAGSKIIFIDTYVLQIFPHVVARANALSIPVVADIESEQITEHMDSLDLVDHLILNIHMASRITNQKSPEKILEALETPRRMCSVITDGENGCWFKQNDKPVYFMPAFKVDAVDTTGCGDVFHGAYSAALIRGESIPTAVVQASAAAAIKATLPGGQQGIPRLKPLLNFCNTHNHILPEKI